MSPDHGHPRPGLDPLAPGFSFREARGPLVATAIHAGHHLRPEVLDLTALDDAARLHEEDPASDGWTGMGDHQVVVGTSRFEVDLNRPFEDAVYRKPEDAWGLDLWRHAPPGGLVERSLDLHRRFYQALRGLLERILAHHPRAVVFDLHTYNHRRDGPDAPSAPQEENPDVNLGTGNLDRERWAPVVDAFMETVAAADYRGGRLDVRENVRFQGGYLSRWVRETFPERVCALAIEVKKIFMDEWTGEIDPDRHRAVARCLGAARDPVLAALERV